MLECDNCGTPLFSDSVADCPKCGATLKPVYDVISGIETSVNNKPTYKFLLKWPIVIPQRCIYCGKPTSNFKELRNCQQFGFITTYNWTMKVMIPICSSTSELCPRAKAIIDCYGDFAIDTHKIDVTTTLPVDITIQIPSYELAEAFAKANACEWSFHYQSVAYYLRGDRGEVPSKESVSIVLADNKTFEPIFISCSNARRDKKTDMLKRFQQISFSFTDAQLSEFQKNGKQRMITTGIFTLLFLISGLIYWLWGLPQDPDAPQTGLGVVLLIWGFVSPVCGICCLFLWFKLWKRTRTIRPNWENS